MPETSRYSQPYSSGESTLAHTAGGLLGARGSATGHGYAPVARHYVLGGLAIVLAIPIAAVLATLVDVLLLQKDPAREDVPSVIVPAGDAQST